MEVGMNGGREKVRREGSKSGRNGGREEWRQGESKEGGK